MILLLDGLLDGLKTSHDKMGIIEEWRKQESNLHKSDAKYRAPETEHNQEAPGQKDVADKETMQGNVIAMFHFI